MYSLYNLTLFINHLSNIINGYLLFARYNMFIYIIIYHYNHDKIYVFSIEIKIRIETLLQPRSWKEGVFVNTSCSTLFTFQHYHWVISWCKLMHSKWRKIIQHTCYLKTLIKTVVPMTMENRKYIHTAVQF